MPTTTLLEKTLEASQKDIQSVSPEGAELKKIPDGVILRSSTPHVDDRGSLFEIFSTHWQLDDESFDYVYAATIRPGIVKGWALHKLHDDRYFIISGEMQVILYDVRPESSTYGLVTTITLSEKNRQLLTIPRNVWHADYNCSDKEVILLNMPTQVYDHANPDKYRLPLDTPLIPHDFGSAHGW